MSDSYKTVDLVLAGGGIKAVAYAGVLKFLEEKNIEIRKIAAVSSATFPALSNALGYSAAELEDLVLETDFSKFAGPRLRKTSRQRAAITKSGSARGVVEKFKTHLLIEILMRNYGFDDGRVIIDWTEKLLERKGYSKSLTFTELPKDLRVLAYDSTRNKELIFSKQNTPTVSVVNAVRASTALVLIFQPLKFEGINNGEHLLTDGGVINHYPIDIFAQDKNWLGLPHTVGCKTLWKSIERFRGEVGFFEFLINHIAQALERQDALHIKGDDWSKTISIDVGNTLSTDFLLMGDNKTKKKWLIEQGYLAAKNYFSIWGPLFFLPEPAHGLVAKLSRLFRKKLF